MCSFYKHTKIMVCWSKNCNFAKKLNIKKNEFNRVESGFDEPLGGCGGGGGVVSKHR